MRDFEIVEIDSIEEIGSFEDEYVYDLEMEDESHTFIGNDMLVHNTDSIFVGFEPAMKNCEWKDRLFNDHWLNKCPYPYAIITEEDLNIEINNDNLISKIIYDHKFNTFKVNNEDVSGVPLVKVLVIDGRLVKDYNVDNFIKDFNGKILYNWGHELDFIQGMDKFRIAGYFKDMLDQHAASYGVENVQDFELEKISESIINLEKKKYIQHITWEDGIGHERFTYFQPKGVELVRSSTPLFARDKEMGIYRIVKYLFKHPEDYNIRELLEIVKQMRKEFEMAEINDISGQSSCSKYNEKVLNDTTGLEFVMGAHFAVKAAAYHNYLLYNNKELQTKYEFLKSGDKIKYYYTTNESNPIFAFKRGEFPIEFAPEVDYDTQFEKVILSPINSIVKKLNMPEINKRLSVIMDIFGGL
jgi:hypothetical protein